MEYEIQVCLELRGVLFRSQAEDGIRDSSVTGVQTYAVFFLRSEEHTSELQSHLNVVCRLLLEKKKDERAWCSSWNSMCVNDARCNDTIYHNNVRIQHLACH